jgi:hypothetical protein
MAQVQRRARRWTWALRCGQIITANVDAHVEAERHRPDDDNGTVGVLVPVG